MIHSLSELNEASRLEALQWFRDEIVESSSSPTPTRYDAWLAAIVTQRPYASPTEFLRTVETTWRALSEDRRIDMLNGHPEIGKAEATQGDPDGMEAREQRGMAGASDALAAQMDQDKAVYRQRFGFIYMIYATGKTADELADALRHRLAHNTREEELAIATTEFWRIHEKRLRDKLGLSN
jgi:2-oxo-4-hydroxy-4-carboxy-5-ureidoimidazoline decarboxylase